MNIRQGIQGSWLFAAAALLLMIYLLAPLIYLIPALTPADLFSAMQDPAARQALETSVFSSAAAAGIIALFGVPLGYMLARQKFYGRSVITILAVSPIVFPPVVSGILLLSLFGPYGAIGGYFARSGMEIDGTFWGILLAQIFVAAPFSVLTARSAFLSIDSNQTDAAKTLTAHFFQIFRKVELPQVRQTIIIGLALSWLRAMGEYGATMIMAYHPYTLPVYTFVQLSSYGGVAGALPLSALALIASAIILTALWFGAILTDKIAASIQVAQSASERPIAKNNQQHLQFSVPQPDLKVNGTFRQGKFTCDATFTAPAGVTVILGASGAGKTTLLKGIAGLIPISSGSVAIGDEIVCQAMKHSLPPAQRKMGYAPQGLGLFQHLTALQNVAFGAAGSRAQKYSTALEALGIVHAAELASRPAAKLSGGEAQRVALARALAARPHALLLDEPFNSLDLPLRSALRRELRALWRNWNIPILITTHDLQDMRTLADYVVIVERGKIIQSGACEWVYNHPASIYAAELLGITNSIKMAANEVIQTSTGIILQSELHIQTPVYPFPIGQTTIQLALAADRMQLCRTRASNLDAEYWNAGEIVAIERSDFGNIALFAAGSFRIYVVCPIDWLPKEHEPAYLRIPLEAIIPIGA